MAVAGLRKRLFLWFALIWAWHPSAFAEGPHVKGVQRLTIDDVLDIRRLDRGTISPDGEWAALVIQRPARKGEVFGRNAYETDPSRSDVMLVSMRTGEQRAVTNGAGQAAGYWCATWSPDGKRLAMLSTEPRGTEPRGGDNVRLYVWERATGVLSRLSEEALPTQMRYGGPFERMDLRGGSVSGTVAHSCSDGEENAPFLWLDSRRILAATLPQGQVSALIDRYARPFRVAAKDASDLRDGTAPTGRAVGSGAARLARDDVSNHVVLKTIDTPTGAATAIASVPTYPFRGALTVSVAPDGNTLAVLATLGAIQPRAGRHLPNSDDDSWTVERRLGFVDVANDRGIRWAKLPHAGQRALALYEWSPDSERVVIRARADDYDEATSLFVISVDGGRAVPIGRPSVGPHESGSSDLLNGSALWASSHTLVARAAGARADGSHDWWLLDLKGNATNLTKTDSVVPVSFRRSADGRLMTFAGGALRILDVRRGILSTSAKFDDAYSVLLPGDPGRPAAKLLIGRTSGRQTYLRTLSASGVAGPEVSISDAAAVDVDLLRGVVLTTAASFDGTTIGSASLGKQEVHELLRINGFMSGIDWGERRLIDYTSEDGKPLKAAVILPPGYRAGQRYPTLAWVYQGYQSRSLDTDYFLDPAMPGFYNMYLYAARGYVVVIPSIPWPAFADRDAAFRRMEGYVLPATDKLAALGITDPSRLGVFGQSRGGYTVFALLAQTKRFKAGIAMSGISDLANFFGEFDPMAHGYPGIEHEKSNDWAQIDQFGRSVPPDQDPAGYASISPLYYARQLDTPLLMLHGEFDMRGASTQSEELFSALYAQGKTAELVRYGGESHSLAQSPANIRDVFQRTNNWFDVFLK